MLFTNLMFLLLVVNLVSAGLCKGSDGYYHDCNDFSDRYYKNNFHENYETEYYKETFLSTRETESIKKDIYGYEKKSSSYYEEENIERYEIKRDYSSPIKSKTYFKDKYSDYRSDSYDSDYNDYGYDSYDKQKDSQRYEYDDEPKLVMFLNNVEPIHYRRRANSEMEMEIRKADWEYRYPSSSWPDFVSAKDNDRYRDYDTKEDEGDYYKPKWDSYKQEYNWRY